MKKIKMMRLMNILVKHLVNPLMTVYIKSILTKKALELPCHHVMKTRVW
jgi:hypothetical protein